MRLVFVLLFAFTFSLSGFSQRKSFEPKGTLKLDAQLPLIIGNSPFKSIMKGLVRTSLYYQHNVYKGLNVGGGAVYSLFSIDEFALFQKLTGFMHEVGAFGKISYQKFIGDKFGFDIGVKAGYSYFISPNDSCKAVLGKAYSEGTYFIEPTLGLELKVNEAIGVNLSVGWAIYGSYFDERFLCLDELPGGDTYKKSNSNIVTLGFGISYYFGYKSNLNE